jgi:O-acetyl-ADP-ribose deacetylase (regulator of RNase III)
MSRLIRFWGGKHKIMATKTAVCAFYRVATYLIPSKHPFYLIVCRGSVVDFSFPSNPKSSAIVNAANEGCLGGGGVDGAIGAAGGPNLLADRRALPIVGPGIRCKTGSAVLTGPNSYGKLGTSYVIHAVGPDYKQFTNLSEGDKLLSSAYVSSLACAESARVEALAFSLLSAGVYRGPRSVKEVLKIGMDAIYNFKGYAELREVHMCAFSDKEVDALVDIADELGLGSMGYTGKCDLL